ncbi:heme oxygenase [Methylopila capsulata]|uniref:Heme oxygenase n=1 Tax=Methylopila capsulata TaxID=61654 RepID=A0A9W6MQI5_9HYPH|nr:biliverdin-producing heme oxygenase [Methylopila capsulata]MBM7851195.1 heme oxygenase [Methylopila capsulata]GLK54252.1 heme oxygenase [Methylopila capsulata]
MTLIAAAVGLPRTKRLKSATEPSHERLDRLIMACAPFASRERYGLFLAVQRAFHHDIEALYAEPALDALLPDLAGRRRLGQIEQDLADLGVAARDDGPPAFARGAVDLPTALGWLYVAEGSNLGAAFLLKEAAKLGLSETFGARHLAGAPEGRGLHWRAFASSLDAVALSETEDARVVAGAEAAFRRVRACVQAMFG